MYRDIFTSYLNDLNKLDPNEISIVTYDRNRHTLAYRQLNIIIYTPYISCFYFPKKRVTMGALTQRGLIKLKTAISKLLCFEGLDKEELVPDIGVFGMKWYRTFNNVTLPTPQVYIDMNFMNVTGRFNTWLLCKFSSNNSKIIYKSLVNERKITPKFSSDEK